MFLFNPSISVICLRLGSPIHIYIYIFSSRIKSSNALIIRGGNKLSVSSIRGTIHPYLAQFYDTR